MHSGELFVNPSESVIDCMKRLDETGRQILFIVERKKLLGIISDGDIRRFILKSGNLNDSVKNIMIENPIKLTKTTLSEAKDIFTKLYITAIPIVNKHNEIVDIVFREDIFKSDLDVRGEYSIPVVLMAGGKGSRLYPYTRILPKPLIPIGDTPIVERIINRFSHIGCNEFYLTVNDKKNMIKAYFNELNHPYRISYIEELKPLGTGGSLALLKEQLKETFFLSNCDILIDGDYRSMYDYHKESGNKITVITSVKKFVIPYGVIKLNDGEQVEEIHEKPEQNILVNTGVYIVEPDVIGYIPENTFFHFTALIEECLQNGDKVGVYPISENSWMDMGQMGELEKMQKRLGEYD